jgi:alpha-glucosidase
VLDLPDEARQDPVWFRTEGAELGRDGCRVPLPWTHDPATAFGFSDVDRPAPPWLPQPPWWGELAANAQRGVPDSVLELYRRVLAVRRATSDLRETELAWCEHPSIDVVAFERGGVLVALNTGGGPQPLAADLVRGREVIASSEHAHADPKVLPGDATVWLA